MNSKLAMTSTVRAKIKKIMGAEVIIRKASDYHRRGKINFNYIVDYPDNIGPYRIYVSISPGRTRPTIKFINGSISDLLIPEGFDTDFENWLKLMVV